MEGNMWIFATLGLLLCWMMPVDSMEGGASSKVAKKAIQLSMVEDSVDDMYLGCNDIMMTLKKDKSASELIGKEFIGTTSIGTDPFVTKIFNERNDKDLTIDHILAIYLYTGNNVYAEFNTAVRTEGRSYLSSFKYGSFHYLLTSAIQILNNNRSCYSTFRRTNVLFEGTVGEIIRFGSFTSTSFSSDLKGYGTETCFKIKTCLGASLKNYSAKPKEEEVLIPPYEMFKITEINREKKNPDLKDCEVVFVLESAGGQELSELQ
ncbi:Erythroblast NAD(P)(+)--arginine ADP-ribosyltransferase [Dissostichus eleginoides]|uniref:NAD(P)(+)--arginine ADP-ribosyltransferase n=1 Tax=Dissostichus eleginoides TaxID=100907 RepID=A0AAD9CHL7_DISEL|nr:Erythroblast NAD(P)(+)--arginine ADP-ribosyltransferase [Dissostichus eleginoides]